MFSWTNKISQADDISTIDNQLKHDMYSAWLNILAICNASINMNPPNKNTKRLLCDSILIYLI